MASPSAPSLPNPVPMGYQPPSTLDFGNDPAGTLTLPPAKLATMSPADQSSYWHGKISQYMNQLGGATDKPTFDKISEFLRVAQAAAEQADRSVQQGRTDSTTATNDVAARAEQNRHNLATEGTAQQNAKETHDYHNQSLGIQEQLAQIQTENEAIRAKAEQDTAAAKGDANAIARARLQYEQSMAAQTAKLQTLKDQVTSLSGIDNNGTTEAVNQANQRDKNALDLTNSAATTIGGMKGITDPNLAASAMGSIMNAARQYSNQSGGGAVPVGQLTDQHKAEITQLVMAGMPFNQAVQQSASNELARQSGGGPPPVPTSYTPAVPSPNPAAPPGFSVNPSSPSAEQSAQTYTGGH